MMHFKGKQYYPCLKTLHDLETIHLPAVIMYGIVIIMLLCKRHLTTNRFTFAKIMKDRIPHLREKIKKAAFSELQV